jgi:hypothetical protein
MYDWVYIEYAPHHGVDIELSSNIEGFLKTFPELATANVLSASYSEGITTIVLDISFAENLYTGRWVYTAAGKWHKIVGSGGSALQVPYNVTSEFIVGQAVNIRSGARVQPTTVGSTVMWNDGTSLKIANMETLVSRGRGPRDIYPFSDG